MSKENMTGSTSAQNPSVKRKRGRPRKDESARHAVPAVETPRSEPIRRNRRRNTNSTSNVRTSYLGKGVSGVIDGCFQAGYLLTVRVEDCGIHLKGVVFHPMSTVPVTEANDVASEFEMTRRNEIPLNRPRRSRRSAPKAAQKHAEDLLELRPLKVMSPAKHASEVTPTPPYQGQRFVPPALRGVPFDINQIPQASPHGLRQAEFEASSSAHILTGLQVTPASQVVEPSSPLTDSPKSLNTEMLRNGGLLSLTEAALNDVEGAVDSHGPEALTKTSQGNGVIADVTDAQHQFKETVPHGKQIIDAALKGKAVNLNEIPVSSGVEFVTAGQIGSQVTMGKILKGNYSAETQRFKEDLNSRLTKMWEENLIIFENARKSTTSLSAGMPSNAVMVGDKSELQPQPKAGDKSEQKPQQKTGGESELQPQQMGDESELLPQPKRQKMGNESELVPQQMGDESESHTHQMTEDESEPQTQQMTEDESELRP